MKTLYYFAAIILFTFSFTSCSSDDDNAILIPNPVQNLTKIYEFMEADHSIEVYTNKSVMEIGYNEISIRIKDKATNLYVENAQLSWMPMMHMQMMQHSAPHSALTNSKNASVYSGMIVFQMPENATEYWTLDLDYVFNGQEFTSSRIVSVVQPANGLKKVQAFMGIDNTKYILAYVNPTTPKVATNDLNAVLYKMNSMMDFSVVENYKITVDPRMPGMGNHSSPNNQDLVYNLAAKMYDGKLSLTMTGYWKINLILQNAAGEVLKGEAVTSEFPGSSLFFEIEF